MFVVVLTVQRGTGRLLTGPDIISRGFIYLRDSEELMGVIRQYFKQKLLAVLVAENGPDDIKKRAEDKLCIFCMTKLAVRL